MRRNFLPFAVFAAGLAIVCWVGVGYVGSNPLGALVAAMIALGYVAGAIELYRFREATASLDAAVADLSATPASLGEWLGRLHPSLRHAVRLRVEGERAALPAPALTPYLVGLLVLLGMLGTLLGMMATLRGTGIALESATDLQAIRGSLAAPVKGLGFAFGTSIAGVATSAMLGLLSALVRRERVQAVQALDLKAATTLRVFSQAYQREASFALLQQQTELMPALIDRLQAMMATIETQSANSGQRHADSQDAFHAKAEATFATLASSVEQSLKAGVADSARAASAALQPIFETTMAGIARETAALHNSVNKAVERQLDGLKAGFATTASDVTSAWQGAVDAQRTANETQAQELRASLEAFTTGFEQGSSRMIDSVADRFDASAKASTDAWTEALSKQSSTIESLVSQQVTTIEGLVHQQVTSIESLVGQQGATNDALVTRHAEAMDAASTAYAAQAVALVDTVHKAHGDLQATLESRDAERLAAWTNALESMSAALAAQWKQAGDDATAQWKLAGETATAQWNQAGENATAQWTRAGDDAMAQWNRAGDDAVALWARAGDATMAQWDRASEGAMAHWKQAGDDAAAQQAAMRDALAQVANDITSQSQTHASATIAEISRLVDAAAEAPKAAADVVAELRQKLSDSMARDTATLEERGRLLETVETLLNAVNHASTEQRAAIDGLVTTSADLLERVGTRFIEQVEGETGKLEGVAERITGSAENVASLGESFGSAVQVFGQSNEALLARLQEIGEALDRSLVRSDEQLAYYVAQAREVVDLSVLSQKQILEDMQQLASKKNGAAKA
ncbi:DUF802 domain-containing protein [Luteibacter aegosomaticola]|uniref:DUF802 domain-containing protein n=1 Tax=Luteibacter aegosomaticola TaxID=2911538 RepID=UPI001FFBB2CF|nr:DUF802 domain-containing protein [Luteibacter aegosomaticola]UPG90418.1 DUF802 domain-containing protein [Luteibacter aegosomaticola]